MAYYLGIDMAKFKGFAIINRSEEEVAIKVVNEASFSKEFILKPKQVYYAKVADVAEIIPLDWAKSNGVEYLKEA